MKAEEVYADPSALARLYIHQAGSREMAAWRAKVRGALAVTHHGRTEIINAICRAAFLGQFDSVGMTEALADLASDFASGHLWQADILWRAALNRAAELSERHTPALGTRSLDVLHVRTMPAAWLRTRSANLPGVGFRAGAARVLGCFW